MSNFLHSAKYAYDKGVGRFHIAPPANLIPTKVGRTLKGMY